MKRKVQIGLAAAAAISAALPLFATPAFADLAPSNSDVVGVGSDTVQYASDFVADGDFLADSGYNAGGGVNRVVNFDATPDANARLAYGPNGVGTGSCTAGTGATKGTGNILAPHSDNPCVLNPTIVLRAGLTPVLRPNGSGAGGNAGKADTKHYIDYVRASSPQGATLKSGSPSVQWDDIQIGNDPLRMLTAATTNAPALSTAQLTAIYNCTSTTWTQVGGTSSNTIIPILPQVGSGTRSSFLSAISVTTPGSCVKTAEENDPFGIGSQTSPADAIEPMSGGRLNLFLGKLGSGASNGVGGYFQDPSCPVETTIASGTGTNGCPATLTPSVTLQTTGTPSDGTALFNVTRPLFVYFRDSDINSATPFQPGSSLNFVRTLFYNPCSGTGCTGFGPGGAPYFDTSAGQSLVSAAGISPSYVTNVPGL